MTAQVMFPHYADMPSKDIDDLTRAVWLLEKSSLPARLASVVGSPVERLLARLPAEANEVMRLTVHTALDYGMRAALLTLGRADAGPTGWQWLDETLTRDWAAKASTMLAGGVGGAAGLAGTVVELPITTALILRSIAQIGLGEGENVASEEFKTSCLSVLAMGGRSPADDATESGYYAVRVAVADAIVQAAGMSLMDLFPRIAVKVGQKFGAAATVKLSAQAVPIVGGLAGATINLVFMDHFQDKARGHFIVRRLERAHGAEPVRACYDAVAASLRQ
jgi:hypothetical protein